MKSNNNKIVSKTTLAERIIVAISKKDKETVISKFLEEINKALINGEEIRFPSHFTFKTTIQKARVALNLQTKKKMNIPAKRVPKVKFSADLKEAIAKKK